MANAIAAAANAKESRRKDVVAFMGLRFSLGCGLPCGYIAFMARKYWSKEVTENSNALALESSVFAKSDPKAIARSLKRSAEQSKRRKSSPYRSAMSMLTFYINRAGKNLPKKQLKILEKAKDELRAEFGRPAHWRRG